MKIGIISGYYPGVRFNSQVNHKLYADKHGYFYIFDGNPERDPRRYFRKMETLIRYLDLFDWVFWIDDDAYFTDFERPLTDFLVPGAPHQFIICGSPSTKTLFTKFTTGSFFVKNSLLGRAFLQATLDSQLDTVRAFWRDDLGHFTEGDQDVFVYVTETDPRFGEGFTKILPHTEFNNRDFEYKERLSEHFLVHFCGTSKDIAMAEFCERLKVNPFMVPDSLLAEFNLSPDSSFPFEAPAAKKAVGRSRPEQVASIVSRGVRRVISPFVRR